MDINPQQDQQNSNEWVDKLRRILDDDIPVSKPLKARAQSIISEKSESSQSSDDENQKKKHLHSNNDSQDISFLEQKRKIKKEQKKQLKRDLYLRIGEEINQNDEIHEDNKDVNLISENEQEIEEAVFNKMKEAMEEEYQRYKNVQNQQGNLVVVEMNVFERINAFDTFNIFRKVIKQVWLILSTLSLVCLKIVTSKLYERISLVIIIYNCAILAINDPETDNSNSDQREFFLLILYSIEMFLKIAAYGFAFPKDAYIRNPWNVLDLIIVVSGYLPYIFINSEVNLNAIRSLRILRPLRTISSIKSLKQIINTIFDSLTLLKDVIIILLFFYLVFAIAGQQLFSGSLKKRCFEISTGIQLGNDSEELILCKFDSDCHYSEEGGEYICGKGFVSPKWDLENFDTFGWALLNTYVVVSLQGWSKIMVHAQETFAYESFIYFLVCVMVGNMFLENLLIAIIQIKYSENEKLLRQKQKAVEDLKMYNIQDFKKWGIYKSNKERYKEMQDNKLRKLSSFGEIASFFKKPQKRSPEKQRQKAIQDIANTEQQKLVEEFGQGSYFPTPKNQSNTKNVNSSLNEQKKNEKELEDQNSYIPPFEGEGSDEEQQYRQNPKIQIPKLYPIKTGTKIGRIQKNSKPINKEKKLTQELHIPALNLRSMAKKTTKIIGFKKPTILINDEERRQDLESIISPNYFPGFQNQSGFLSHNLSNKSSRQGTFIDKKEKNNNQIIQESKNFSKPPLPHKFKNVISNYDQNSQIENYQQRVQLGRYITKSIISRNNLGTRIIELTNIPNQKVIIPAKQVESENEDDFNILQKVFDDNDEDFLEKIEKFEQENEIQFTNLQGKDDFNKQQIKPNDNEIETHYRINAVEIDQMIKKKQKQMPDLTNMKEIMQIDNYLPPLPSIRNKSSSEQISGFVDLMQSSQNKGQKNDNNSIQSKKFPISPSHVSRDSDIPSFISSVPIKKNNIRSFTGAQQLNVKEIDDRSETRKHSYQTTNQKKGTNIIFFDEDFYDYQETKHIPRLQQKGKTNIARQTQIKGNQDQSKSIQKEEVSKQEEKVTILNQVFNKDEGQLYKQIFANKLMTAKVLYSEVDENYQDILPRESRAKRQQKKQELIENIKKRKYQIIYSAEKRVKLRSQIIESKKKKKLRVKTIPVKKSKQSQLLVQQQVKVYDIGIVDYFMKDSEGKSSDLSDHINIFPINDATSQETFNQSPSVVNHYLKAPTKISSISTTPKPSGKQFVQINRQSKIIEFKQKSVLDSENNYQESQQTSQQPFLRIQNDSPSVQNPAFSVTKQKEIGQLPQKQINEENIDDKNKQEQVNTNNNLKQFDNNQSFKKVVKSILRYRSSPQNSPISKELSQPEQPIHFKRKNFNQGDKLIYNWDVDQALESVFPTLEESNTSSQREENMNEIFGENLSIYSNILDQNSSRLSITSSLSSSRGNDKFSSESIEITHSPLSSCSSFNKSFEDLKSMNYDSKLKKGNSPISSSTKVSIQEGKNQLEDAKEMKSQQKEERKNIKKLKGSEKLDQMEREPAEIDFIKAIRQQINNLVNKGIVKIKDSWSGDDVLVVSKMLKSSHSINVILKSMNYSVFTSQQNEGGMKGIINAFRRKIKSFIQLSLYENMLMICVIINTIILALDGLTDNEETLNKLNEAFTYIFAADLVLKLTGLGYQQYVSDKLNIFDASIVALSVLDMILLTGTSGGSSFSTFRFLRIFRVLRVLRVTRLLRQLMFMKILIQVIESIVEKLFYILLLLVLYIFIYALIGRQIYYEKFEEVSHSNRMRFDSFLGAAFTVFNLMTIEKWYVILQVALRTAVHPSITVIYLISCIFIGNFIIMNLVLATMIEAFISGQFDKEKQDMLNTIQIIEDIDSTFSKDSSLSTSSVSQISTIIHNASTIKSIAHQKRKSSFGYSYESSIKVSGNYYRNDNIKSKGVENQDIESEIEEKTSNLSGSLHKNQEGSMQKGKSLAILPSGKEKQKQNDEERHKSKEFKSLNKVYCKYSLFIFSFDSNIRKTCFYLCKKLQFDNFILLFISLSSIKLISDTYFNNANNTFSSNFYSNISQIFDIIISAIFTLEFLIKIIAYGFFFDEGGYLRDYWSQLDFFVVVSSLVDVSYSGVNLGAIKILRLLRTLRPLRLLNHNKSMKLIATTLLESLPGLLNMVLVLFLVWLMFAIFGVSLMQGKLNYCKFHSENEHHNIYHYQKDNCEEAGGEWEVHEMNFENVMQGLQTLFIYSTFSGWPDYSWNFIDANSSGPVENSSSYFSAFICTFIIIGSFFSIDLFGAVLAFHYDTALKRSKNKYLSDEQSQWIELQRLILKSKPDYNSIFHSSNKIRLKIWKIAESKYLEIFIIMSIIGNIITMSIGYDTSPSSYDMILSYINLVFSFIFILECLLKITAYGLNGYFYKNSNKFDFFVVAVSILDIIFNYLGQSFIKFISAGPQIARIFRVFRVTRVLRLVKKFEGLQKLLQTLIFAMPSLINATALLFLLYFIFAILACFLYSPYQNDHEEELNHFQNFSTFHRSFLLLFRLSTGEEWQDVMFAMIKHTSQWSCLFFIIFFIVQNFVIMNLFVLIIIQQFEENYINPDNPLNDFKYSEEDFKKQWVNYTRENFGAKIHERFVPEFYFQTLRPLGFDYKNKLNEFIEQVKRMNEDVTAKDMDIITGKFRIKQKQLAEKDIMQMGIKCDYDGFIYFNELLYYFFKFSLYPSVFERSERVKSKEELERAINADLILMKVERSTLKKLKAIKKYQANITKQKIVSNRSKDVNPMVRRLFIGMCFKSWQKFSTQFKKNLGQMEYVEFSSDSESDDYSSEEENQNNPQLNDIDKFYKGKAEDNIFEKERKERKTIISRQHTIYLRNKIKNEKKNSLTSHENPLDEPQFFQFPNAFDIYKEDYFQDDPKAVEKKIEAQLKEEQMIRQQEAERAKVEQQKKKQQESQNRDKIYKTRENSVSNSSFSKNPFLKESLQDIPSLARLSIEQNSLNNFLNIQKVQRSQKKPSSIAQFLNSSNLDDSSDEEEKKFNSETLEEKSQSSKIDVQTVTKQQNQQQGSSSSESYKNIIHTHSESVNSTPVNRFNNPSIRILPADDSQPEILQREKTKWSRYNNNHLKVPSQEEFYQHNQLIKDQMPQLIEKPNLTQILMSPNHQSISSSEKLFSKSQSKIKIQQQIHPLTLDRSQSYQ